MSTDTYTTEYPKGPRCEERRSAVLRYRIPAETRPGINKSVSNYPFTGMLIAATAKSLLPALRRSIRSKYGRHVGAKQLAKISP